MKKIASPIRTLRHEFNGNGSGFVPIDTKVLVLPDYIDETSEGGIVLTSDTVDQNELSVTEGFLVDMGSSTFSDWSTHDKDFDQIVLGIRVVWAIYAGQMLEGDDGKMYRLMNDTDLAAIRSPL